MRHERIRPWLRRHHRILMLLILVGIAPPAYFSQSHHWQWDLTQNGRHTLSAASRKVLGEMPGPATVTVYATLQDGEQGDLRQPIRDFVARYQRLKPDLSLQFVDPAHEPRRSRDAGVRLNGELVLTYRGRTEHLVTLNEQDFSNALMRLARGKTRQVMSLSGHGERNPDGAGPHDFGEFARQLARKGFNVGRLDLALEAEVPAEVGVLLLTPGRTEIPAGETDKIKRYLARGGNLIWLLESGPLRGLQPVAEALNLNLTPGIVLDPAAREMGFTQATALAATYGPHPVTARFDLITAFPSARPVAINDDAGWRATPLIEAAPRGWVELGAADENAVFDNGRETPGPVVIGLALERDQDDKQQRVTVIGSTEFLANSQIGNGGNLDLGINLLNWLAGDANLITIQPKSTLDSGLNLSRSAATTLTLGFLLVLPASFFVAAALVWRRRRGA